jgi:hypothetical protein
LVLFFVAGVCRAGIRVAGALSLDSLTDALMATFFHRTEQTVVASLPLDGFVNTPGFP